jgi:hypothetical protein
MQSRQLFGDLQEATLSLILCAIFYALVGVVKHSFPFLYELEILHQGYAVNIRHAMVHVSRELGYMDQFLEKDSR